MGYSNLQKKKLRFVFFWISIIFLLYLFLRFIPIISTFYLSFFRWDLIRPVKPFVGFNNFIRLLQDENFKIAIWNTSLFAFIVVTFTLLFSLLVALALERKIAGGSVFEIIFFLPIVIPLVPISLTWKWIYDPTNGVLNYLIGLVDIPKQGWLINPRLSLGSIMAMTIWQRIGYNMIIFLVGLREIPAQFYEAAKVDGAGKWQTFISITLPLLIPITLYLTVMNTIEAFRIFTPVYVMTTGAQGAPASAVRVLVMDIYQNAFRYFNLGYASAESLVLFLIILLISLLQFGVFRKRGVLA